jgi:hypothetical protein
MGVTITGTPPIEIKMPNFVATCWEGARCHGYGGIRSGEIVQPRGT